MESNTLFASVIFAAATVVVLVALSEVLRLCILIEHNTRRGQESHAGDEAKLQANSWLPKS
jgi:hypothetical protein